MNEFVKNAVLVVLGGSGTGIAAWFTYLRTSKTRKVTTVIDAGKLELAGRREAADIQAEAYAQAQRINQETVAGLLKDVRRLEHQQERLRTELDEERRRAVSLEQHVGQMQNLLKQAGIPVPGFSYDPTPPEGAT